MRTLFLASAMALTIMAPLSVQAATTQQFSFSSGGGEAVGSGSDSCTLALAFINVSRAGTHNLSAPSTSGLATVILLVVNNCTGAFFSESGSTTNFQFSAPGAPNVLPRSVTASGTVAATCTGTGCPSASDTFTFSMALQAVGNNTVQVLSTVKTIAIGVTLDEHQDSNIAFITTGTVTLSSQNVGALPPLSWQTTLSDERTHMITLIN